jgi:hypothetical protein
MYEAVPAEPEIPPPNVPDALFDEPPPPPMMMTEIAEVEADILRV